jgi:hypothetical protein
MTVRFGKIAKICLKNPLTFWGSGLKDSRPWGVSRPYVIIVFLGFNFEETKKILNGKSRYSCLVLLNGLLSFFFKKFIILR